MPILQRTGVGRFPTVHGEFRRSAGSPRAQRLGGTKKEVFSGQGKIDGAENVQELVLGC